MKRTLLIVGKGFSELERYIRAQGYDFKVFPVDLSAKGRLAAEVDKLKGSVDGVLCVYEAYVAAAAEIASRLGLLGLTPAAAAICTDKFLMRQALAKAPEPISADFAQLEDEASLVRFAEKNSFPLIIKPANLTKSLLVTKSHNLDELLDNYRATVKKIDKVYARYAPGKQPRLIVEEFLQGPAHSVEAFIDKDGRPYVLKQVVDYRTGYDIGYDDNFHYSRLLPSALSSRRQAALIKTAEMGARALGMTSSAAHIEIIYTKHGPKIVEIGARNGGYRPLMHRLANGIDIYGAALATALGRTPELKATRNDWCSVLELFPKKSGKFIGIKNQAAVEKLPSLVSFKLKHKIGETVGKSSEGYKMCAIIVLHNQNRAQFEKDLNYVDSQVSVQTI